MKNFKSILVTTTFGLILLFSVLTKPFEANVEIPLIIFYLILLVSTYYSISLFDPITPKTETVQFFMDGLLVMFYIGMAANITNPYTFTLMLPAFFVISTLKYLLLLGIIDDQKLLKRKTIANSLGALLGIITYCLVLLGYKVSGLWFMTITFSIAHIYILFINPLYRSHK